MKAVDIWKLQPKALVLHKRYGKCTVEEVIPNFGVVITPHDPDLLAKDSGMPPGTPLLESTFANLKKYL
jgi:hypothetical protein